MPMVLGKTRTLSTSRSQEGFRASQLRPRTKCCQTTLRSSSIFPAKTSPNRGQIGTMNLGAAKMVELVKIRNKFWGINILKLTMVQMKRARFRVKEMHYPSRQIRWTPNLSTTIQQWWWQIIVTIEDCHPYQVRIQDHSWSRMKAVRAGPKLQIKGMITNDIVIIK